MSSPNDTTMKLPGKWKKGVFSVLFSRMFLVLLFLAIQIVVLLMVWAASGALIAKYFIGGQTLFEVVVVVILMNSPMDSSAKISWMLVMAVIPFFGTMFYIWTQTEIGHRNVKRSLTQVIKSCQGTFVQEEGVLERLREEDAASASLVKYLNMTGGYSVYQNTEAVYFSSGEEKFEAMLEELKKAESFIFMEYFIIDQGFMWDSILEILVQKAKEGVEVRVMYDGMLELGTLPRNYPEKLASLGIKCKPWERLKPVVTSTYNYRDHRKILVIDGRVGFNGGINIGDEYINRISRFGHWKDTAVLLRGEGVRNLMLMFLQMWNAKEKAAEDFTTYMNAGREERVQTDGFVISYGDSPFDDYKVGEMVYMNLLNTAKEYVYIMTPYLILDGELETALKFTAERGVDVRLILPGIPDKKGVWALAKNHYGNLLKSGVKLYEYTPGFVHAKMFVSDNRKAVVGTINLDYRSLYHHFECATYLSGTSCVQEIFADFLKTQEACRPVTTETIYSEKLSLRLAGSCLKLIAPLL